MTKLVDLLGDPVFLRAPEANDLVGHAGEPLVEAARDLPGRAKGDGHGIVGSASDSLPARLSDRSTRLETSGCSCWTFPDSRDHGRIRQRDTRGVHGVLNPLGGFRDRLPP